MKKNVLALSITAGLLAFAGGAQAIVKVEGATGTALQLNGDGVGHSLLVPYFTTQNTNVTLLSIVNTDTINGKAVKVRFRGAANSDDIFDFQVFLSPGDVWTANVSKNANGLSYLSTTDASCTKPAKSVLNTTPFQTTRLNPALTGDALANGTREGYVEIFNMGDIPKGDAVGGAGVAHPQYTAAANVAGPDAVKADGTAGTDKVNDLYYAIKHVNKVAPCAGTAYSDLDKVADIADAAAAKALGLLPPSTGLMANWMVVNVVGGAAWSGAATAIQATNGAQAAKTGNVVYWAQIGDAATTVESYTADPLLRNDALTPGAGTAVTVAARTFAGGFYDLPDLSTPYVTSPTDTANALGRANAFAVGAFAGVDAALQGTAGVSTYVKSAGTAAAAVVGATFASYMAAIDAAILQYRPYEQANLLTRSIAASSITNEYLTDTAINATTDWVFSMPTRRYSVALNYAAINASPATEGRRFTEIADDATAATLTRGFFVAANTVVTAGQICVNGVDYSSNVRDREETQLTGSTQTVVSPSSITPGITFCGEAAVLSVNNGGLTTTGALKAAVAVKDLTVPYSDGWMKLSTPSGAYNLATMGAVDGLPVLGGAFAKASAGTSTFGATWPHRFGR